LHGFSSCAFSPIFASTNNHKLSKNVSLSFVEKYKSIGQNQPLALAINQFFLLWEQLDKLPLLARKFLISSMSLFLFAKIRQTCPSWTAQYFPLSFVGQIFKFNVLLGTKNYNSFLAF